MKFKRIISAALALLLLASCSRDVADSSSDIDLESLLGEAGVMTNSDYVATVTGNMSENYEFGNLPIGGGGYVTGIVIHPKDTNIKYIRTDVGGAYKWDAENKTWIPMTEFFSNNEGIMYGIDGIAIDPNDENVVYITCGDGGDTTFITPALYKSTNKGETFERTSLEASFFGNAPYRQDGEPIMVDPNNSNVVYCGTRKQGLKVSYDAAKTWQDIPSIPANDSDRVGIRSVAIDTTSTIDGRSKVVYVSVSGTAEGNGVFMSTDGGVTFKLLKGIPSEVRRLSVSCDGVLYATTADGVYKYENGKVTDISPKSEKRTYRALAVSTDGNKLVVCHANTDASDCMNMNIYYSADRGSTWTQKNNNMVKENKTVWWPDYYFSSATASLIFDPQNDKEVWFTDWYGVWMTKDITEDKITWRLEDDGHEEAVITDILSNKEGDVQLVTAMVDNGGMFYTDINEYPLARRGGNSTGLDFCEDEPQYVVLSENDNAGTTGAVRISNDYGRTFKNTNFKGTALKIAQNPKNFRNFMVLCINEAPKYTTDSGKTWQTSAGVPTNMATGFWGSPRAICSDRFQDGVFYIHSKGRVYRSTDGGKNFSVVCDLMSGADGTIKANPYKPGEVYVTEGRKGLYISKDSGGNFTRILGITKALGISFGPSKDGNGYVTYLLGTVKGKSGLFMSEDGCKTFIQLNDEETNKLGKAGSITADRRVYGRVFMGSGGRGIITAKYKD